MCPHPSAADTLRTLIAAVPDDRLRELSSTLRSPRSPFLPSKSQDAPRNGDAVGRGKGASGKGKHKIDRHRRAYLDAHQRLRH